MPYSEPDPTDPHSLVGVSLPTSQDCDLDMAYVIVEEFARLGFDEKRLLGLFRDPFYRSAYRVFQSLGEERVQTIIQEGVRVFEQGITGELKPRRKSKLESKPGSPSKSRSRKK